MNKIVKALASLALLVALAFTVGSYQPLQAMPTAPRDCHGNAKGHAYPNPQTVGMEKLKPVYLSDAYPGCNYCPPPNHCYLVIIPGGPIYTQCR